MPSHDETKTPTPAGPPHLRISLWGIGLHGGVSALMEGPTPVPFDADSQTPMTARPVPTRDAAADLDDQHRAAS